METQGYILIAVITIAIIIFITSWAIRSRRVVKLINEDEGFRTYQLKKDANFRKMFTSISKELDTLCIKGVKNEEDVRAFVKEGKDIFLPKHSHLFLFKKRDEYRVARVLVDSDGLYVSVYRFGHVYVWHAVVAPRVVVPQLGS